MTAYVIGAGVQTGYTLHAGDTLTVRSGGTSLDSHISSGGSATVFGTASGDLISRGGSETISSGGMASSVDVENGGWLTISAGGSGFADIAAKGGGITDRGLFENATMGGALFVTSGGLALRVTDEHVMHVQYKGKGSRITVEDGAKLFVNAGGSVSDDVVGGPHGGSEVVSALGVAYRSTVTSGGSQDVLGLAVRTTVDKDAVLSVGYPGTAKLITVKPGGSAVIGADGTLSGAVIDGGKLIDSSGLAFFGVLAINDNGTAIIGATFASGSVIDLNSGTLEMGTIEAPAAAISGMSGAGQRIDLLGVPYSAGEISAWGQSAGSGTLAIVAGTLEEEFTLIGNYRTSDIHLSSDRNGGTYIVMSETTPSTIRFAQTVAGFSGRDAGLAVVHSGGVTLESTSLVAGSSSGR